MLAQSQLTRSSIVKDFEEKYPVQLEDNCHRSSVYFTKYMTELGCSIENNIPNIPFQRIQFMPMENQYLGNIVPYGYLGEEMIWRKFEDNNSGRYTEMNYRGHSCPGYHHRGQTFVFDPILLPSEYGLKGIDLDMYLYMVTKPSEKRVINITVSNIMTDGYNDGQFLGDSETVTVHSENVNLSTNYNQFELEINGEKVFGGVGNQQEFPTSP